MDSEFRVMNIKTFRAEASAQLRWVEEAGGMLWLQRRGRIGCAVLPFYQVKVLDTLLGSSLDEKARGLNAEYKRFAAAKRVQAAEERARLARGLGAGGEARSAVMGRMMEAGREPWEKAGVLVEPW